jgi:hypothetical protein
MSLDNLFNEMKIRKSINLNSEKFIQHKNLTVVKFKKSDIEETLSVELNMGSNYLINKNNIIEIYSYIDHDYSQYIQVNKKIATWISKIDIVNIEKGDPHNVRFILDGFKVLYTPSDLIYIITEFLHDGFKLYIPLC